MKARYQSLEATGVDGSRSFSVRFRLQNRSRRTWRRADGPSVGWQIYDPAGATFIAEGDWTPLPRDLAPGDAADVEIPITLPAESGPYRVYVSLIDATHGWLYASGEPFALVDAAVEDSHARLVRSRITTLSRVRWETFAANFPKIFAYPLRTVWNNRRLIRSMVHRDILARYRGSFGDTLWTILNPLLLMAAYFFVFGVVLESRFPGDPSKAGFVLYFLSGMLPWLAFSEAAGRAPTVLLEHRNFVKKLVFAVETLPVNLVVSGLVSEFFAVILFCGFLLVIRHSVPATVLWLPVLLVPQVLFTTGISWFFAALGAFIRDLGQFIGFLMTIWFFTTPICYPEDSLPSQIRLILSKNPLYVLVRGYRAIFLEHHAPAFGPLWELWLVAAIVFVAGHAWFYKLRKSFADML